MRKSIKALLYMLLLMVVSNRAFTKPLRSGNEEADPLKQITAAFPGSITVKGKGRTLEFCPDNTCDAFQGSPKVSKDELTDFAYLYLYFFSDYYVLGEWREKADVTNVADRVLSRRKYENCSATDKIAEAKCILRYLSRHGRIQLLFIRYDENRRNVVRKNLDQELSKAASGGSHRHR